MKDSARTAGCVIDGEILSDAASQSVSLDISAQPAPGISTKRPVRGRRGRFASSRDSQGRHVPGFYSPPEPGRYWLANVPRRSRSLTLQCS
jgi:hypothetical protein